MVRLTVTAGKRTGYSLVSRSFPLVLGRGNAQSLSLEDAGVWEDHAVLELSRDGEFTLRGRPEAAVIVNGQRVAEHRLRNGDLIELGAARVRFTLSETESRGQRWRETTTWLAVLALCALQVALVYWLP